MSSMKRRRKRTKKVGEEKDGVRCVSQKHLWAMKRKAQKRDRELVARGKLRPEDVLLIRPDMLEGAKIVWPDAASLIDKE